MIPNVCMKWCERQALCKWCNKPIEAGKSMVAVFYWNKGTDGRRWNTKQYFHPQCWIEQGLDYLKMNPYVPYIRKPRLALNDEDRKLRYMLLRRKSAIDQRRKKLKPDNPDRILIEARLDGKVAELMIQMMTLGGIPKKWLD